MTNEQFEKLLSALTRIGDELEKWNTPDDETNEDFCERMAAKHGVHPTTPENN